MSAKSYHAKAWWSDYYRKWDAGLRKARRIRAFRQQNKPLRHLLVPRSNAAWEKARVLANLRHANAVRFQRRQRVNDNAERIQRNRLAAIAKLRAKKQQEYERQRQFLLASANFSREFNHGQNDGIRRKNL